MNPSMTHGAAQPLQERVYSPEPLLLAESYGFRSGQLKDIRELIEENSEAIKNKWNEHVDRHRKAQS